MAGGSAPSSLRIRLLGGLAVDDVAERDLGSRKARTLLKALALARGSSVPTDRLVDLLWGDSPPARPSDQVGVLVSRLRGVLGAERLPRTSAGYAVVADWLDVDELAARVDEAAAAVAAGRLAAARATATAALALARGPLLVDEDGDWVDAERAAVEAIVGRARRLLAEAAAGDHDAAAVAAEAALAHDPYDEVALQILMRAHAGAGRPASALAAYAKVRERLAEDLGVSPTVATEALHDEILLGAGTPEDGATGEPGAPTIVGRRPELATLDAALRAVTAGGARLVLVEGEPGIGKTALVAAFAGVAAAGRAVVLRGHCDELGRDLPLEPVLDALATYRGRLGDDLASLLSGDAAVTVADAELGRARLFDAVLSAVLDAGGGRPIVLTIDDLHLAGDATLAWLAFARRRAQRLLVVATRRSGHARVLDADVVTLGPLAPDEVAELVGDDRAAEIYERSNGNPLFATALASAGTGELPVSVRDAADAVADGLGAAGSLVRSAAVLGEEIDLDLLAEVLETSAVELLGQLELAAGAGLLDERGTGFAFRHGLVREALAGSTGSARRALLHRAAARGLAARTSVDPLAVAVHARLGGDNALAAAAFVDAASAAAARFDIETAETHLDASLGLLETASARTARARLRIVQLRHDEAAEEAARAIALDGGPAALEVAGWAAYYRRRYGEAEALADEAVALAGGDDTVRASCLALAGRVRHGSGDLRGADERLTSVDGGPYAVRGVAEVWLGHLRNHQGRPVEALELLDHALRDPDRLAHPFAPLHGRFARIMALGHLGRVAEALRACDDLDAAIVRAGAYGARFPAIAANMRAWLLRAVGRFGEADDGNRFAAEYNGDATGLAPAGEAMAEGFWVALLDLVEGRLVIGDLDGAAAALERVRPIDGWTGGMAWHQRHRLGLQRARLALAAGDDVGAAGLATAVSVDAGQRGARRYEVFAGAVLGLAGADGDLDGLDAVVQGLAECAGLEGWRFVAGLATRYDVDRWRSEAERRASALLAACDPDDVEPVRAAVAAVLG